jgi:hypothetical protein
MKQREKREGILKERTKPRKKVSPTSWVAWSREWNKERGRNPKRALKPKREALTKWRGGGLPQDGMRRLWETPPPPHVELLWVVTYVFCMGGFEHESILVWQNGMTPHKEGMLGRRWGGGGGVIVQNCWTFFPKDNLI